MNELCETVLNHRSKNIYKLTIYEDGSFPFLMKFSTDKYGEETVKLFFDERTLMAFIERARTLINKSPFHFLSPLDSIQGVEIMGIRFGWNFLKRIKEEDFIRTIDIPFDTFKKITYIMKIKLPDFFTCESEW